MDHYKSEALKDIAVEPDLKHFEIRPERQVDFWKKPGKIGDIVRKIVCQNGALPGFKFGDKVWFYVHFALQAFRDEGFAQS